MTGAAVEHTDQIDPIGTKRPYRPGWLDYLTDWVEGLPAGLGNVHESDAYLLLDRFQLYLHLLTESSRNNMS